MRNVLRPILAVLGIMLANCGGSESVTTRTPEVASVAAPHASAPAPAASATKAPQTSGNRPSAGVTRTY